MTTGMSIEGQAIYPGGTPRPLDVLALADEYRRAASALLPIGRQRPPLSRAPFCLLAVHAIELCLNAHLLATGHSPIAVRRLQHDLALKAQCAVGAKRVLKRRTLGHLARLSERRECLTTFCVDR